MTSVTLEEKKLKLLKQQLFGKEQPVLSTDTNSKSQVSTHYQTSTATIDSASLRRDMIKIITFSFIALAIQFSLFFASKQGLIHLFR